MSQELSSPQPGASIKIINAGLPRSGTSSASVALAQLLEGPVYHAGSFNTHCKDTIHIRSWTRVYELTNPTRNVNEIKALMHARLDGYVAVSDLPPIHMVPELLEMYPEAKVICTLRDPVEWGKSMGNVVAMSVPRWLHVLLRPLPHARYMPRFVQSVVNGRWAEVNTFPGTPGWDPMDVWNTHIEWLKSVVPKEKLFFCDVRDGWEPLARACGVEVPQGIEFPRVNEAKEVERFAKETILKGIIAWVGMTTVVVGLLAIAAQFSRMS